MTSMLGAVATTYQANSATNKVPTGYKITEVGVIPEEWNCVVIGELVTDLRGGAPFKPTDFTKDGVKVLPKGGVIRGGLLRILEKDQQFCSPSFASKYAKNRVNENYTIVVLRDLVPSGPSIGLMVRIPNAENFILAQGVYGFLTKNEPISAYLIQYSNTNKYRRAANEIMVGSTQVHITNGAFKEIRIAIPSDEKEQTAIANALSDVDALIQELEKLIAKKQAIKTATMQQLLTGRTRLPAFAYEKSAHHPDGRKKGYKPSELGEIPEDWECMKMGDLAKIQRGASPRPIDSPIWFDRNSSVGWLRISDLTRTNKFLTETTQSLSELGVSHSRFVPKNNLVMSICATVGKPIITKRDLCIHDGFVVFNGLTVNQDFMYYVLKELEDEWSKQGQTGSQMNLNTDLINGTNVCIPNLTDEQIEIALILSDMDEEVQALEQRLNKTRQIKQGMMQELLTGKTRLVKPAGAA